MKKKFLALVLTLAMVLSLLPATALATGGNEEGSTIYVDAMNGNDAQEGVGTTAKKAYKTVEKAVAAAASGDTIQLGEGNYTLYKVSSEGHTKGKDLTFVGQGADKTGWNIGAEVPDPANFGTEYNGDYSFDGAGTVTFKDMTLRSGSADYLGFIRADQTVVDNCTINGKTFYWGYTSATFTNTTFNCPSGDYALWTYSSPIMTFDTCTFNSSGKVINVYTDFGAGKQDITVNFKDCTVADTGSSWFPKQVLNVNDSNMGNFKYVLNISGNNTVSNVPYDKTTCSRLYGFGGKAGNNTGRLNVSIDGTPVWQGVKQGDEQVGKMVSHKHSAGEQDDAFKYSYGDWTDNGDGTESREVTKTCEYCGYAIRYKEDLLDVSKSKTATPLNTNTWTSDVTLSLPSAEENLASDVVFVLDKSECAGGSAEAAKELVSQLLKQQELEKATLKVGVVAFGGTAIVVRDLEEIKDAADLDGAVTDGNIQSLHGTNIQAGLIEADKMLSKDTEVSNNRKYVVLISDGHTYEFSKEGEYGEYVDGTAVFEGLKTYGIYNETDLYAYAYGISYTIHSLHDQYYTGDYNSDGIYKGDWHGKYLTDDQYIFTNPKNNAEYVKNEYEMPYGTWDKYLKHISEVVAADGGQYDMELKYDDTGDYGNQCIGNGKNTTKEERAALADEILGGEDNYIKCGLDANGNDNQLMHASGVDRAVYEAYTKYASMAEKYHCYPIYVKNDAATTTQDYGYQLMHALGTISNNTGTDVSVPNEPATAPKINAIFTSIKNDILYAVSAGSTVTDTIGKKFDFAGIKSLTVGDKPLTMVKGSENVWYFGSDDAASANSFRFKVEYDPDTDAFVWTINENVSNFAPVQLTYTVQLTTPETDPGTYGTEDLKGEKDVSADKALFTNESAVLNAINSAGAPLKEQAFPKPSVFYTVKSPGGGGGSHKPPVTIPDDVPTGLNGKDHYAYVVGYPDGMVYPQKNITRAEVATIFFRLLEDETREANMTKSNGYNDMKDGAWYTCAVSTLSKMGIIKGYEDGSFKPDASISRAEFAAIAARFDPDGDKTPATFSDVSSHWAKDEISIAANHGWIKGYEDGSFKPDQKITRAETMTLVNRVLKRLPETKDDLHKDMKTWPDNQNESAWFYLAVQEATNSHYQNLKKDGTHEKWESMRETRDWAALEK